MWAILEPAAGIALLTIIFAAAFHSPPIGISFAMFYATGMVPFMMFNDVQGKIATALMYSKQLLAYPTVTYLDAIIARFLLNFATQTLVAYVIFAGSYLLFETRVSIDLPTIILAHTAMAALALGFGIFNSYMFTRFPLYQRGWSIVMKPMFILSCIFFLFETIPQPYNTYLWFNPLIHPIGLMRSGFYATYDAGYVSLLYVFGLSLGLTALGLLFLRRHYRDLLNS